MVFLVHWVCFGYSAPETFRTLDDAIAHAREVHFTAAIYAADRIVATWCPIGGTRRFHDAILAATLGAELGAEGGVS